MTASTLSSPKAANAAVVSSSSPPQSKQRADKLLVSLGIADTRARAHALIVAGVVVEVGSDRRIDKPGMLLSADTQLRLKEQPLPYVSRGGLKLAAALAHARLEVTDAVCLDVGASTGGFTDCLLQAGARRVYAVDVGYNQLAWSLRQDPRVVVLERCNIRTAPADLIAETCEIVVMDVSFISLRLVLPPALRYAKSNATVVALVKPQFEVGRQHIGKHGVVKDTHAQQQALADIVAAATDLGLRDLETLESPILGAKGNREFLLIGHTP